MPETSIPPPSRRLHRPSFIVGCFIGLGLGAFVAVVVGGLVLRVIIPPPVWDAASVRANRARSASDLTLLGHALESYRRDFGAYPTTEQGLAVLVDNPKQKYIGPADVPSDPWKRPYHYQGAEQGYEILSYGADGRPGGTGIDGDMAGTSRIPDGEEGSPIRIEARESGFADR